ncbi:hypothetical protein KC19_4G192000, partial [Ceratodon purpureus]
MNQRTTKVANFLYLNHKTLHLQRKLGFLHKKTTMHTPKFQNKQNPPQQHKGPTSPPHPHSHPKRIKTKKLRNKPIYSSPILPSSTSPKTITIPETPTPQFKHHPKQNKRKNLHQKQIQQPTY